MMARTSTLPTDREAGEQQVSRAVSALQAGELVVLPTETVYGLAALATDTMAVQKLRAATGASATAALAWHVADVEQALGGLPELDRYSRRALQKLLPGPVTVRVQYARSAQADFLQRVGVADPDVLFDVDWLTVRRPSAALTREVIRQVQEPVVMAGLRDSQGRWRVDTAPDWPEDGVVVDGGRSRYARPSALVAVEHGRPTVLREGVYDARFVSKLLNQTVLFVCTGNTCRSPMAEALARHALADRGDVTVMSAGVFAGPGAPASAGAFAAMQERGLDLSGHRTRTLTPGLVQSADVVYAMTASHAAAAIEAVPTAANKVKLLDPQGSDVADPFGGQLEEYRATADAIERFVQARLKELV